MTELATCWTCWFGAAAAILLLPLGVVLTYLIWFALLVYVIPRSLAKRLARASLWPWYRFVRHGWQQVPATGPVLLVANHVSWLDGILMMVCIDRPIRMIVYGGNFERGYMKAAAQRWGVIILGAGPKAMVQSLRVARESLAQGEVVGIFPEGAITRSGVFQGFKPGMLKIIDGTGAAVVPIYLDGLWGSIFSYSGRKFFWKWPRRFPYRVDMFFGAPLRDVTAVQPVRLAVQELGAKAVSERMQRKTDLPGAVIRACKQRMFQLKVADSAGTEMTGGSLLMRSLILRRLLRRHVLQPDEAHVGVLLPPSAGGVVTNLALSFDRRVAINLNYTVSSDVMNQCIRLAGIRHVLTSRKVMEKLELQIETPLVYLEDLRENLTVVDKLASAIAAFAVPAKWLSRWLKLHLVRPDDLLTIIFTSGSTGIPKGVMLTHANVRSNVDAVNDVIHLQPRDTIVGILPFFHSFGYTVTLWTVMALNIRGVYHFNPLDARQVGKLIAKYKASILLSTPTFLRSYVRRCERDELASLDTVVTGAEKLPKELADAFEQKFGTRPVEGYGTTELSPLVSVNVPPSRAAAAHQHDSREGTVGRCVPGVTAKIVNDRGETLPVKQSGMLLISGPNVMKGYYQQPDKTAEVIRDGWYVTGDIAFLDEDGFITITGRESRFSKIGGEMVPHLKIEECLQELLGADEEGELRFAVTSVSDEKKGERLIVLYTSLPRTPVELVTGLKEKGLPNLFIPSTDSFLQVPEIPVLGTGKLDLRALKELAEQRAG